MKSRINFSTASPGAVNACNARPYFEHCAIEPRLRYLVELRVSQINGCVYCIDMHSEEARLAGEKQQRLDCLPAWREAPFFSERERAALGWAESVTHVAQTGVPDEVYEATQPHFSEKELVDLTFIVASMNLWNRVAISFRTRPAERR